MEEKVRFVDVILKALDEEGLLDHFMVVGSWCVYFYAHKFKETFNLPPWSSWCPRSEMENLTRIKSPALG
jgi:hypothetical protein